MKVIPSRMLQNLSFRSNVSRQLQAKAAHRQVPEPRCTRQSREGYGQLHECQVLHHAMVGRRYEHRWLAQECSKPGGVTVDLPSRSLVVLWAVAQIAPIVNQHRRSVGNCVVIKDKAVRKLHLRLVANEAPQVPACSGKERRVGRVFVCAKQQLRNDQAGHKQPLNRNALFQVTTGKVKVNGQHGQRWQGQLTAQYSARGNHRRLTTQGVVSHHGDVGDDAQHIAGRLIPVGLHGPVVGHFNLDVVVPPEWIPHQRVAQPGNHHRNQHQCKRGPGQTPRLPKTFAGNPVCFHAVPSPNCLPTCQPAGAEY